MAERITWEDFQELKINIAKFRANGEKYFGLFDKHIPVGLAAGSEVLLYKIGNVTTIKRIADKNSAAKYHVYDRECVCKLAKIACLGIEMASVSSDEENQGKYDILDDKDMKFDLIIMNPPYSRNLHLKILAEAIRHLKDEKSLCVNLSPVLWLEDPHAHMKPKSNLYRFKHDIVDKCLEIDVVDMSKCNSLFNIALYVNLGVYVCAGHDVRRVRAEEFWKRGFSAWEISLFERVYGMPAHLADVCEKGKRDGIRALIAFIAGGRGALPVYKDLAYAVDGLKDGKDWTECKMNTGLYKKPVGSLIPFSVKFGTEIEAQNFYDSWKTPFLKWLANRYLFDQHIQLQFLPWLGDAINPRTGLKGYLGKWTNEDLYRYFKISAEEQKAIEEIAAKYR